MTAKWQEPGSDEHGTITRAALALKAIWVVVCHSNTSYFVSAFADVLGRSCAENSDAEFETDLRSLMEGLRLVRATAQSETAVKSS